jgi:hypothetical protein
MYTFYISTKREPWCKMDEPWYNINKPMPIKKLRNGRRTRNQEIRLYPALQIELRINVQKAIYNIFAIKTIDVLGTLQ